MLLEKSNKMNIQTLANDISVSHYHSFETQKNIVLFSNLMITHSSQFNCKKGAADLSVGAVFSDKRQEQ